MLDLGCPLVDPTWTVGTVHERPVVARLRPLRGGQRRTLTREGWSSKQTGELATSELYQQQAAVRSAQANLTVAQRQLEALRAQRNSALASRRQARAVSASAWISTLVTRKATSRFN